MPDKTTFAVIGGDLRQAHLAGLLSKDGYNVAAVGFDRDAEIPDTVERPTSAPEAVRKATCIVLPLPYTLDGATVNAPFARTPIPLEDIWANAGKGALVTGGMLAQSVLSKAELYGFRAVDYYKREELTVLNAIPTAEGAIQIAMEELPVTIHGSRCLVAGFGRIAKMLCRDLSALGADVTCCARKYSDLSWIKACGYRPAPFSSLPDKLPGCAAVFNTVPALVFDDKALSRLDRGSLLIDLASKPGGVDFEAAGRLGVRVIWALSLPGKVAPMTSGAIIRDTIMNIIDG